MRRKERQLFDEMKLTIESILGILKGRPAQLPSEVLWKLLARDLLTRIDNESSRSDGDGVAPDAPSLPSQDDCAGRARDAAGIYRKDEGLWD